MPGHFCDQCQPFIDATSGALDTQDREKLRQTCSRHKAYHAPKNTPEDFWDLSFIDSQEKRKRDSFEF